MIRHRMRTLLLIALAAQVACAPSIPDDGGSDDGGAEDAGVPDGGPRDGGGDRDGGHDAGVDAGVDAGPSDAGEDDAGADAGPLVPDALASLGSLEDLALMADESGGVKYLAPVDGAEPTPPLYEDCAFQNTARYSYHLPYLQAQPGGEHLTYQDYIAYVLRRATRVWWGGGLRWLADEEHPLTGEPGVLSYTLYTEDSPGNRLIADDVRDVHAVLTSCAPGFEGTLAFVPSSNEQRFSAQSFREELAEEGIAILLQ